MFYMCTYNPSITRLKQTVDKEDGGNEPKVRNKSEPITPKTPGPVMKVTHYRGPGFDVLLGRERIVH